MNLKKFNVRFKMKNDLSFTETKMTIEKVHPNKLVTNLTVTSVSCKEGLSF